VKEKPMTSISPRHDALLAGARSLINSPGFSHETERNVNSLFNQLDELEDSAAARDRADMRARERMAFSNALRHGRAKISRAESDMLGDLRDARILMRGS
jgi:hypothetical protein